MLMIEKELEVVEVDVTVLSSAVGFAMKNPRCLGCIVNIWRGAENCSKAPPSILNREVCVFECV